MLVNLKTTLGSFLAALVIITGCAVTISAQIHADTHKSAQSDAEETDSIEAEMRAKREIRFAEKQYRDNLDRAELLSVLGKEIQASYKKNNSIDRNDLKKLDKLEKLAKGIREAAGGSEDKKESKELPADLASAVSKLGDAVQELKQSVQKTPKRVISATVIDQANELLELIRLVRNFSSRA